MKFISFDPGATGCMAIIHSNTEIEFLDFKTHDIRGYAKRLWELVDEDIMVAVENVHSMPKQGIASTFKFGVRAGEIHGMLMAMNIGFELIRPQEWQKQCGIKPKSGKKGTYDVVQRIFPTAELKGKLGGVNDGRCDALGIAYALRKTYA